MEFSITTASVLLEIFLYCILLYQFIPVYRGNYNNTHPTGIFWYAIILILFCTFAFTNADFYYYKISYDNGTFSQTVEPVYIWLKNHLSKNYYSWRLVVWGFSIIILFWTIQRLGLDKKTSCGIITLFYATTLYFQRASLGMSILFLGYSLIVRPTRYKTISLLLGAVIIVISFFFHKTMLVPIAVLLLTIFNPNKKAINLSLILFPLLVSIVTYALNNIGEIVPGLSFFDERMNFSNRLYHYFSMNQSVYNFNGIIRAIFRYTPDVLSLGYATKLIAYDRLQVEKYITPFFVFWYDMTYIAALFIFQDVSSFIFERFLMMSYIPRLIVLIYLYRNLKRTPLSRFILISALLSNVYDLSYTLYTTIR